MSDLSLGWDQYKEGGRWGFVTGYCNLKKCKNRMGVLTVGKNAQEETAEDSIFKIHPRSGTN